MAPKKIDKTNENLLEELINTDISPHVTLKDIGPTISLPFDTDHLDDKEHADNVFDMQFASDVNRNQNGVDSLDETLNHNADHANSNRNSLSSPGALSSSSNGSSRHASKSSKPNTKGYRRLSSAAEKVNKSSKSEVKNYLNINNSGANQSRERTSPTKHSKSRNVPSSAEKKQKWNAGKSKAWVSDSESESDFVDVETVTPDGKRTSLLSNSLIDEKKASVLKKLFMSPKDDNSSASSQGSVPSSVQCLDETERANVRERVSADNKQKGHRKREKDKEVKSVHLGDDESENGCSSDRHVDDIIQTTTEFKPPVLLSPIPPISSPSLEARDPLTNHVPGVTCSDGTPSIIVQINLMLLDRIPAKDYSQSASDVVAQSSDTSAHSKVLTDTELVSNAKSLPSSSLPKDSPSLNSKSFDGLHSHKLVEEDQSSEKTKSHSDASNGVLSEKIKVNRTDSPDKIKSKTKMSENSSSNKVKSGQKVSHSHSVEKAKLKSELPQDSADKNCSSKLKLKENELLEEKNPNPRTIESKPVSRVESDVRVEDNVSQVKLSTKLASSESLEKVKLTTKVNENELPSEVKSNNKVFSSDSENKTKHRSKSSAESVVSDKRSQKRKTDLDQADNSKRHKSSSKSSKRPTSEERVE